MTLVQAHYEAARDTPSDINEHLPELVRLVEELQAQTVIELGVRFGASTFAWLHALEQTDGHLWSVDVERRHPWALDDHPRWTFVQGYDLDLGVTAQLPDQADIIFIDTDHRYELTKAEIEAFRPRVRPGGVMVFHDTNVEVFDHHVPGTEPPFPVRKAVMESLGEPQVQLLREWHNNNGLTEVWL